MRKWGAQMKQFKTIFQFEYANYIRSKSYLLTTLFLVVAIVIASAIPTIVDVVRGFRTIDGYGYEDEAVFRQAIIVDVGGLYTDEILAMYLPGYRFTRATDLQGAEAAVDRGEYALAVMIDGLNFRVYERSEGIGAMPTSNLIRIMVQQIYQLEYLAARGLSPDDAAGILFAQAIGEIVVVGTDATQNFFLAYGMLMLMYFVIIFYGQYVSASVITEKSSKAMELLITSARPFQLMMGKVIGVGAAGLTQFGLILITAFLALQFNQEGWVEFAPAVAVIFEMSISLDLILLAVVFFVLGFTSYAFLWAGFASTVSRLEEANSVVMIPMLLFVAAFLVAMSGIATPTADFVVITSFVPFLSPLIMFMRICLTDVPPIHIIAAIAINIGTIILAAFVASRIYRVGVMMYGKAPNMKDILKYIVKG